MRRLLVGLSQKFRINSQQRIDPSRPTYRAFLCNQIDCAGLVDRRTTPTLGGPLGTHWFAAQEIKDVPGVLVLGDIAAWHIAVYSSATPSRQACSLVRVETAGIGPMNRPSDSTSTPWTGNTVFGVMPNFPRTRK